MRRRLCLLHPPFCFSHSTNYILEIPISPFSNMQVLLQTNLGDITLRLYDETPQHRDNFLRLVREGYYNGTLFHRVTLQVA